MRVDATRKKERFVYGVCNIFETEYLRRPKNEDVERLLQMGNARGFPGQALVVQYIMNRTQYNMWYYLADGIYLEWATFVKTIPMPQGEKRKLFAEQQESARKDVERAFGVL
uniref:Uncharacterized protein n=1 Tax=Cajanus cajan TaxID=3821 RepID=A0A151RHA3_CAJCA|nr:hypothetical protein KK1_036701 [Cajanus cajan]